MSLLISGDLRLAKTPQPLDADAQAYVNAVEVADRQRIEDPVRFAINDFVIGCKADGIWIAIKASCILAGARTLSGALVPLVGTAPTNFNFVSGDYNRKTGLVGNATTKYLNSNRNNNADPQDSKHLSTYATSLGSNTFTYNTYIGALPSSGNGRSDIELTGLGVTLNGYINASGNVSIVRNPLSGFLGVTRPDSATTILRCGGGNTSASRSSMAPYNGNIFVLARNLDGVVNQHINARLAFYSIGESLDLALLDTRVTTLVNAFAAAIP